MSNRFRSWAALIVWVALAGGLTVVTAGAFADDPVAPGGNPPAAEAAKPAEKADHAGVAIRN